MSARRTALPALLAEQCTTINEIFLITKTIKKIRTTEDTAVPPVKTRLKHLCSRPTGSPRQHQFNHPDHIQHDALPIHIHTRCFKINVQDKLHVSKAPADGASYHLREVKVNLMDSRYPRQYPHPRPRQCYQQAAVRHQASPATPSLVSGHRREYHCRCCTKDGRQA